ncbi:MAG: hypothetical protein U0269_21915 [Polyangiales bacterium]
MPLPLLFAQLLLNPAPPQVEPAFARPAVIREEGPSPEFYRRDPRVVYGVAHTQVGAQLRIAPTAGIAFTVDALGGALLRMGRTSEWGAIVEGGYSYVGFSEHFVLAGLGLAHHCVPDYDGEPTRERALSIALTVHGLGGFSETRSALGFRGQISIGAPYALFTFGYQLVQTDAVTTHELRFTLATLAVFGGRS